MPLAQALGEQVAVVGVHSRDFVTGKAHPGRVEHQSQEHDLLVAKLHHVCAFEERLELWIAEEQAVELMHALCESWDAAHLVKQRGGRAHSWHSQQVLQPLECVRHGCADSGKNSVREHT